MNSTHATELQLKKDREKLNRIHKYEPELAENIWRAIQRCVKKKRSFSMHSAMINKYLEAPGCTHVPDNPDIDVCDFCGTPVTPQV